MEHPHIEATSDTTERYRQLAAAARALTEGEPDRIANYANVAALLYADLPDVNWVGFYRVLEETLVVGPFQGKAACVRIPFGEGVCGTAALRRQTVVVEDVDAFPGHIACDAASRSEIVVPVVRNGEVVAVLDVDSPKAGRFDDRDRRGLEKVVAAIP
ncbi:MAG: GAF domain-containing protein [Ectothiorhodospiraceae bacterium]|jgi:GAF domain-containing protein